MQVPSSSSAPKDFTDPKIKYVVNLLNQMEYLHLYLLNGNYTAAATQIYLVTLGLSDDDKDAMKKLCLRVKQWQMQMNFKELELQEAYGELSSYFHRTYYKDFKGYHGVDPDKEDYGNGDGSNATTI